MEYVKLRLLTVLLVLTAPLSTAYPENVTLELRLDADRVFLDGSEVSSYSFYTDASPDFPYIVSGQPAGIVGYGEAQELSYFNRSRDVFRVTQEGGRFLLPFTRGGHRSIEKREEDIEERSFLNQLEPSFGFPVLENRVYRIKYLFQQEVAEFRGDRSGINRLSIQNTGSKGDRTALAIESD